MYFKLGTLETYKVVGDGVVEYVKPTFGDLMEYNLGLVDDGGNWAVHYNCKWYYIDTKMRVTALRGGFGYCDDNTNHPTHGTIEIPPDDVIQAVKDYVEKKEIPVGEVVEEFSRHPSYKYANMLWEKFIDDGYYSSETKYDFFKTILHNPDILATIALKDVYGNK